MHVRPVLLMATAVVLLFACSPQQSLEPGQAPHRESSVSTASITDAPRPVSGTNEQRERQSRIQELTQQQKNDMTHVVWYPWCPVSLNDLRDVQVSYVDFDGKERSGNVVVHKNIAETVAALFDRLHQQRFPLHTVRPLEHFAGDYKSAMSANNTFAFQCRTSLAASSDVSKHAYGLAIDINPLQNPLINDDNVIPIEAKPYADRDNKRPGMLFADSPVVREFANAGFVWSAAPKGKNAGSGAQNLQHFTYHGPLSPITETTSAPNTPGATSKSPASSPAQSAAN